jgi:hypothetical protein
LTLLNNARSLRCGMEPPSLRTVNLGAEVARRLLGVHAPACLFARLFTSSLNSASARPRCAADVAGRPNGSGEGSTDSVSPAPLTWVPVQGGCWIVQDG